MYVPKLKKKFFFAFRDERCFRKEAGKDIEGSNIDRCGDYLTQAELEAACKSDVPCLGYTMTTNPTATGAPDADGFKPWCLKSAVNDPNVKLDHNLYVKTSCKGKKKYSKILS